MIRGTRQAVPVSAVRNGPAVIEARGSDERLDDGPDERVAVVRDAIQQCGAVLLRGFAALSPDDLHRVVDRVSGTPLVYDERSTPRRQLGQEVYTSTDYPPAQEIFLHNENAYASRWPGHLYFYAAHIGCSGGATPIAENAAITEAIDSTVRDELITRGLLHRRTFIPGVGLRAQDVFAVPPGSSLDAYLAREGYQAREDAAGRRVVDYPHGPLARHPVSGEVCWFNHAAFFQREGLDEATRAAITHLYGDDVLPNQVLYGDGERIPGPVVEHLRVAYASAAQDRPWSTGDLLILDNMRYAHGRRSFAGERSVWVAMARPCRRVEASS